MKVAICREHQDLASPMKDQFHIQTQSPIHLKKN